jgi:DNA primase
MDAVEEIKQRLSIEDVISEYVELKRSGRNYKGLSPFSSERTPSFMVSPEKQIWHDFSSGRGGDMFKFVMEMEGLDFRSALEHLARKAGVDLSLYDKGDGGVRKKKDKAHAALSMAVRYYQQSLLKSELALDYVTKQRKLRRQTIADFGIGYSPNTGKALIDALTKKGVAVEDMKLAGLVTERYGKMSDMFRGRVMIPLIDAQGNPLGFTARLLHADDTGPKYINTPQTVLYDKSRHVFGLHTAKEAIRTSGFAVIVEGNMDVISTHQAGYKNVVATAGTAITTHQLKILQRLTPDIRLCFDQDKAGIAAAERAIDVAQSVGVQLQIISLPEGKDPDELIQKSSSMWEEAIHTPTYAVDWLIERYREMYDVSTANGKRKFSDALARIVNRLQDSVEKDHYIQQLAKVAEVSESAIKTKLSVMESGEKTTLKKRKTEDTDTTHDNDAYQDQLLSLLVMFPITRRFLETADTTYIVFSSPERQRVFEYVIQNPHVTITDSIPEDLKDVEDYVKILLLKAEELYAVGFDANERLRELQDLIEKLKTKYLVSQRQQLSEQIKQAEDAGDEVKVSQLLEQFNQLLKKGQ